MFSKRTCRHPRVSRSNSTLHRVGWGLDRPTTIQLLSITWNKWQFWSSTCNCGYFGPAPDIHFGPMSPRRGRMPQAVIAATATATELPTSDETVTPVLPNITNESPKIGLPMKKM